jgi:hypothetical protein
MTKSTPFGELLELADSLSLDEKESFLEVFRQRTIQERRKQLAREARSARKEYEQGRAKPTTVAELMPQITN